LSLQAAKGYSVQESDFAVEVENNRWEDTLTELAEWAELAIVVLVSEGTVSSTISRSSSSTESQSWRKFSSCVYW
jgi:hypothetical protein